MYEPVTDQQASGRIGPSRVFLDRHSSVGDVAIEGTRVESQSNFSSLRASTAVYKVCVSSKSGTMVGDAILE
jgi:hypothetical protein